MRSLRSVVVLAVLIAADGWLGITLWTAITDGDGHGAVFWAAIGLIAAILAVLLWGTVRLAASFASHFARPS